MKESQNHKLLLGVLGAILTIFGAVCGQSKPASAIESSAYVGDGYYYLINVLGNTLSVNSGNVSVTRGMDASRNKIHLTYNESRKTYQIESATTKKAVDVAGAGTGNGTNVQMYSPNGTCAQSWAFSEYNPGTYVLRNSCSGKALDVAGGSTASGANVQIYQYNGTKAQQWRLISANGGPIYNGDSFYLRTGNDRMTLDVSGGSRQAGANVQIWRLNYTGAQRWAFYQNPDGSYRIKNPQANKSLDVAGGSRSAGANVQIWHDNDTCAQKWYVLDAYQGGYKVRNACSGLKLATAGGRNWVSGANVGISTQGDDWWVGR